MCSNNISPSSGRRDFKKVRRGYKSKDILKRCTYSCKTLGGVESNKTKSLRKKKISKKISKKSLKKSSKKISKKVSKKNVQFLEGLGLKVKQKD